MKHAISIFLAAITIVLGITFASHLATREKVRAGDDSSGGAWEYLVVQGGTVNLSPTDGGSMRKADGAFSREAYPLEKNLDKLGMKGWELVTVTGSPADPVFYFKRRR